jgi:hypothetical protein
MTLTTRAGTSPAPTVLPDNRTFICKPLYPCRAVRRSCRNIRQRAGVRGRFPVAPAALPNGSSALTEAATAVRVLRRRAGAFGKLDECSGRVDGSGGRSARTFGKLPGSAGSVPQAGVGTPRLVAAASGCRARLTDCWSGSQGRSTGLPNGPATAPDGSAAVNFPKKLEIHPGHLTESTVHGSRIAHTRRIVV